jgi:hypothetical protein
VALPLSAADEGGEGRHAIEHGVDAGDHVVTVDHDRGARGPQRDVEHRALLGDVDLLAAEHRIPPLGHAGVVGHRDQQAQGLVGHAVLGVVEEQAGALGGHPLAALAWLGEQRAQVEILDLRVVRQQRLPGRALGE